MKRYFNHKIYKPILSPYYTLISLTKLAVALATSFADWTKWRLATGLDVFEEAIRHELQRADVCLAITVAADNI